MSLCYQSWVERWLDHLLSCLSDDSGSVLADHARSLELGDPGDLPPEVLHLFRIDLEASRRDPEWDIRLLQASYAATFTVIRELVFQSELVSRQPGEPGS